MSLIKTFTREMLRELKHDQIMRHAAATAYYSVFSLPALILIILSVAGKFVDATIVNAQFFDTARLYMGNAPVEMMQQTLKTILEHQGTGTWTALTGTGLLVITGSGIIREIQKSINDIIETTGTVGSWIRNLMNYMISLLLIILTAVVLIAAIISGTLVHAFNERLTLLLGISPDVLGISNILITYGALVLLIFFLYLFLPAKRFPFIIIFLSSVITTSAMLGGTMLASYYISNTGLGQAYGVAASILILLFWIYFAAAIFLFGVELMEVANRLYITERKRKKSALRRILRI